VQCAVTTLQSIARMFEHFVLRELHVDYLQRLHSYVNITKTLKQKNKKLSVMLLVRQELLSYTIFQMHVQLTEYDSSTETDSHNTSVTLIE